MSSKLSAFYEQIPVSLSDEEQEAVTLATQTAMSFREAKFFLALLADWRRKQSLSDAETAQIKQSAIDGAYMCDDSPVTVLLAMYAVCRAYSKDSA